MLYRWSSSPLWSLHQSRLCELCSTFLEPNLQIGHHMVLWTSQTRDDHRKISRPQVKVQHLRRPVKPSIFNCLWSKFIAAKVTHFCVSLTNMFFAFFFFFNVLVMHICRFVKTDTCSCLISFVVVFWKRIRIMQQTTWGAIANISITGRVHLHFF